MSRYSENDFQIQSRIFLQLSTGVISLNCRLTHTVNILASWLLSLETFRDLGRKLSKFWSLTFIGSDWRKAGMFTSLPCGGYSFWWHETPFNALSSYPLSICSMGGVVSLLSVCSLGKSMSPPWIYSVCKHACLPIILSTRLLLKRLRVN